MVDVLVRVSELIDAESVRNAFVIAKGVNGVFRKGDKPIGQRGPVHRRARGYQADD